MTPEEERERIEAKLKQNYADNSFDPKVNDIIHFIDFLEKNPSEKELFKDYAIFKCFDRKWKWDVWERAVRVYLDSPFHRTGLSAYYELEENSQKPPWALSVDYENCGIEIKKIAEFAEKIGAQTKLEPKKQSIPSNHPEIGALRKEYGLPIKPQPVAPQLVEPQPGEGAVPPKPEVIENPDPGNRRSRNLKRYYWNAPKKKSERVLRTVRTTQDKSQARRYLEDHYTNSSGKLICQLCQETMPFKKKNGEYYFETVELLVNLEREIDVNYLALCPTCAAKFNEYVVGTEQRDALPEKLASLDGLELPLEFDGYEERIRFRIRFVEVHLADIKTVLEEVEKE